MSIDLPVAKKSLGQHWLNDSAALQSICDEGQVSESDTILEIGPGMGTLTDKLLSTGAKVVAVELDRALATILRDKFKGRDLQIHEGNILEYDLSSLPKDYKVIANIPYYLTSNLIRVLSETPNQASRVVLLVQKEVAERVAATPGSMSLLSVSAQYFWDVSLGSVVPAKLFSPPPKVDSQVLIMSRRQQPLYSVSDPAKFFQLVKSGFAARRKTLLNSLSGGLRTEKEQIQRALDQVLIDPSRRAQTLSLDEWHKLYDTCLDLKIL